MYLKKPKYGILIQLRFLIVNSLNTLSVCCSVERISGKLGIALFLNYFYFFFQSSLTWAFWDFQHLHCSPWPEDFRKWLKTERRGFQCSLFQTLFLLGLVTLDRCLGRSFASKLEQCASSSPTDRTLCSGGLCCRGRGGTLQGKAGSSGTNCFPSLLQHVQA